MLSGIHPSIASYSAHAPPKGMRDELIRGEIIMMPNPKPLHVTICGNLQYLLRAALKGSDYAVHQGTNLILEEDQSMPAPDVFVIDKARWKKALDADVYPEGSPQLAIDVASASNRPGPFRRKIDLYLDNETDAVWVIYPKRQAIIVHDAEGEQEYRVGEDIPLPTALLDAKLPVGEIFEVA